MAASSQQQQPATGWTLWIKNAAVLGARYDFMKHVDSRVLVAELISNWVAELKLDCHRSLVSLHLVHRGPGRLTKVPAERKAAEEAATVLDASDTLGEASVTDGSWLLAVFASAPRPGGSPGSDRSDRDSPKRDDAYQLLLPFLPAPLDDKMHRAFISSPAFRNQRKQLKARLFKPGDVARLLIGLKNFVCTTTRHLLVSETGIVLDGPVPGSCSGQGSTSVRFALAGSAVYAAKVGPPRLLGPEFAVSEAVAAAGKFPTVMRIFRTVTLPHSEGDTPRAALLMPVYAMSLSDAALSLPPGRSRARDILAFNVALCGAAAVAAFSGAGFAHGDIKPGNFMLDGSGLVVAIDFGTAQRVGAPFTEGSCFGLDALGVAGAAYDLTCLGSTLWSLQQDCPLPPHSTRASLLDAMAASLGPNGSRPPAAAVAQHCLAQPAEASLAALRDLLVQLLGTDSGPGEWRDQPGVVDLDVVWPRHTSGGI